MKYFLIVTLLFLTCSSNSLKWNTKQLLQKQKTIYIIPLNGVNQNDVLLSSNELQNFYHYNVIVLSQDVIPNNIKLQTSGKYNANKILKFLGEKYGYLDGKIVGITNVNISTKRTLNNVTYNDWSILGLGAIGGQSCIISTKNMVTNHQDRLSKVTIHEVGHTLGLSHCDFDPKCLMNDAKGKASKVDSEDKVMCEQCRLKIGLSTNN
jgi:archaemetzincin